MRTIRVKLFKFNELSDKAKAVALDNARSKGWEINWAAENRESMEKFADIFPIKVTNWSYGGRGEGVSFSFVGEGYIEELSGQRLATYLWNNYRRDLYKQKQYSIWSKTEKSYKHYKDGYPVLKKRISKIFLDDCCPLTGYYMDNELLDPIYAFMKKPDNRNFEELLEECFSAWIKACNDDVESQQSDEYISDHMIANDYEFDEDGERY